MIYWGEGYTTSRGYHEGPATGQSLSEGMMATIKGQLQVSHHLKV